MSPSLSSPSAPAPGPIVACGMYAFSPDLQHAWNRLFCLLPQYLADYPDRNIHVSFQADDDTYLDPDLLIAHTCGYPYLKRWSGTHQPVCAPQFAVDGCSGSQYSSWFITSAGNGVSDLESTRGKRVGVSGLLSNSGMNVLRHAVAGLSGGEEFFGEVILTGSHLTSIDLVARGEIDLAAIDAVTYALVMEHDPDLQNRIRIVDQSAPTTGLPFITSMACRVDSTALTTALNLCVSNMDENARAVLKLTGFEQVSAADYDSIEALEKYAIEQGYPEIA